MEDNVALGIRIAVTVVLVASLVATVLTLLVIGQSIMGGGQNKLQTGLTQIQQQDLEQYGNVTKKGSVVRSTIALYQGEPIAILVKTTALATDSSGDGLPASQTPESGTGDYFNYGCLLKTSSGAIAAQSGQTLSDGGTHSIIKDIDTANVLKKPDGQSYLEGALHIQNGVKSSNYDTSGTVAIGNSEAILDNGIFYCQLIKDITGSIIGICFTQQK